ncbi:tyrosine-protein kinase-like otk [Hylaeus anthracinus]|uniref:tyrosine-protein kinase-like otk n=1 Tax=Hylaeus volcanicus TaxID=313075 RepID=UPI0023B85FFA|nr:tyrosine-protein kinase-like otk [Hylaeus volcanicus]XP_054006031.1 tyrosine-protein kinase-like otk [Hylaeus anthracinus]
MRRLDVAPLLLCLVAAVFGQDGDLYFSVSPGEHSVVEGSPVRLRCEAQPSSRVKYSWKIDDQPLAPSPRRHQDGGDLRITRVNRILDSGKFVCVATHEDTGYSIESSPAKIDIQWIGESSVQLQQPKLLTAIRVGAEVELRCHVDGTGDMKYEWFKNHEPVAKNERIEIKKKRLLHIHRAILEDSGMYSCLAKNKAGSSPKKDSYPLIVTGNDTATIKVVPRNLIAKRGEPVALHCVFEDADSIQWYFKDIGPLETDDERTVLDNGTLFIRSAEHRDQGFYSCRGERGDTSVAYTVELQIAYLMNLSAASFEPLLPNQVAVVGEDQELQVSCLEPSGLPTPKVYWKDPKGHIISDSGPVRVQDNTLIVAKAGMGEDDGNYTCVAENMAGETDISVQVVISTPPTLISSPESQSVMKGDSVTMTCSYSGMEPPMTHVRWLKDGEPVKETGGPSRHNVTDHHGNVTLHLRSAELSDRGSYVCEVFTKGFPSILSEPASLAVEEKLKFSPEPVDKRLELGSTAKVPCKSQGATNPTVKWIKEGVGEEFPKHVQDINGTLHFNGVLEEDEGRYTCIVSNMQESINHTINITVIIAPKFTVQPQNPTEAIEGYPVMLHCAAEGDPKPTIQWDKDLRMSNLENSRFEVLSNGSLYIKEVYLGDEGKYGCMAGNSGGLKREEVQLNVKPGDPYRFDMDLEVGDDGSMMTKTVTITLSAAAAYMVLVVGLMLYCRYRRRRRKQQYLQEQAEEKLENGEVQEEQTELKETATTNSKMNSTSGKKKENRDSHNKSDGADTSLSSNQSIKSKSYYDKLIVSRGNLKELKPLGRGEFGDIYAAKYQADGDKESLVMVKSLLNTDETALQEFRRHLDLLRKLNHENVVKLIGLSREEEMDHMILEYTDWGDLKQFLIASRKDNNSSPTYESKPARAPQLSVAQIISLSSQAAKGLKHLADNRLVHEDIAARNCLIASNLTIKISMPCMTKEPYHQEYTKHRNQVIPLRWLPYEVVYEDEYSTKSDVYSFACLVWEMFHQGELPFNKMNDESVLMSLKARTLTWKPHKAAPPALQELQIQCWANDPRDRPTFDEIVSKIGEIVVDSCL